MLKKTIVFYIFFLSFFGFVLRILGFEHITWTYDQSRDVIEAMKIITSGDFIKIQGPMTDIPGIFHGALYWYILAPFVYLNSGMPYVAKVVLILINITCIPALFYVTDKIFDDKRMALIASSLFAVSFEAIEYARWMSNPAPALLSTLFSMYGLLLMTRKNARGIVWFLLSWPFSIQFQFVLTYQLLFFITLLLWNFRPNDIKRKLRLLSLTLFGFVILVSPFIVGLVKYRFQSVISLFTHFTDKSGGASFDPSIIFTRAWGYFNFTIFSFSKSIVDFGNQVNIIIFFLFIFAVTYYVSQDKRNRRTLLFLTFWIFSPFVIYSLGTLHAYFVTLGNLYGYIILSAYLFSRILHVQTTSRWFKISALVVIFVAVIFSNFRQIIETKDNGEVLFAIQNKAILSDIKKVVDVTYQMSDKNAFSINTVTNPLFINTTWAYAYNFYGKSKYGYLPAWKGIDQKGRYGDGVKFGSLSPQTGTILIQIREPMPGIPDVYVNAYESYENRRSKLLDARKVGNYVVEKRIFTNEMGLNISDISNEIKNLKK